MSEFAARRRKEYIAALKEELEGCKRAGQDDRVAAIEEEIKRASKPAASKAPTEQR